MSSKIDLIWVWILRPPKEIVARAIISFSFRDILRVLKRLRPFVISRKQDRRTWVSLFKGKRFVKIKERSLKKTIVPKIKSRVLMLFWRLEMRV